MKKKIFTHVMLVALLLLSVNISAQTYRYIHGFSKEANDRIEAFLNSTLVNKERKVAIFDCDGTLFKQAPFYLADEALYAYAKKTYDGKKDALSKEKMAIIDNMLHGDDNVGMGYVEARVKFFAGLSPEEISQIGADCYHEKYKGMFYPEMKVLLANLEAYGIESWVLTGSPEFLYQKFVSEETGIPLNRILGVKSIVRDGKTTAETVHPVTQDWGKTETIYTMIKARPVLVAGNSRGDMEMMDESVGLKIIVNPDPDKVETKHAGNMTGMTVKQYWDKDPNCLEVSCEDIPVGNHKYVSEEWGIKPNKSNPKKK